MSVDHLYYSWWLDDEGHPWVRHECRTDGKVDEWRLPPPWRVEGDAITPSLDCTRCGAHSMLYASDRHAVAVVTEGRSEGAHPAHAYMDHHELPVDEAFIQRMWNLLAPPADDGRKLVTLPIRDVARLLLSHDALAASLSSSPTGSQRLDADDWEFIDRVRVARDEGDLEQHEERFIAIIDRLAAPSPAPEDGRLRELAETLAVEKRTTGRCCYCGWRADHGPTGHALSCPTVLARAALTSTPLRPEEPTGD